MNPFNHQMENINNSQLNNADRNEAEKWRQLFEEQKSRFDALLSVVAITGSGANVQLPNFDPDSTKANAHAWINTAKICLHNQDIKGAAIIKMLSSALKGSAADWLKQICYPDMSWQEFQNIFIARYDCLIVQWLACWAIVHKAAGSNPVSDMDVCDASFCCNCPISLLRQPEKLMSQWCH